MKLQVMAVYDSKARTYIQPFFCTNVDVAKRVFADAANTAQHQVGMHSSDFTLFNLGTWDDETAVFSSMSEPLNLGLAANYKLLEGSI